MEKRVIIGDLHGIGVWKDILELENPQYTIFLGDYFDSFSISPLVQYLNFCDIIKYKESHPSTTLLIGNHDYHYLMTVREQYSGYNTETQGLIGYNDDNNIIAKCIDNGMKIAYIDNINQTIYSHAGVSQKWINEHVPEQDLCCLNTIQLSALKFTYRDGGDCTGSSEYSSPIWIRPKSLLKCPYKDHDNKIWNQVFGHTGISQPHKMDVDNAEFWNIDCLKLGFYIVELLDDNGKLITRTVKQLNFD